MKQETKLALWVQGASGKINILHKFKTRLARRYRRRGNASRDSGAWDQAIANYRMCLTFAPSDAPIWIQYGHVLKSVGRLNDARSAYAAATRHDPSCSDAFLHLGIVLLSLQDYVRAAAAFTQGAKLKHQECFFYLLDQRLAGHASRAIADFWPAMPLHPIGLIEHSASGVVTGWTHDPNHPNGDYEIEFVCAGDVIGRCLADRPRPDLSSLGLGDVGYGFLFDMSAMIDALGAGTMVSARISGRMDELVGSPIVAERPAYVGNWLRESQRKAGISEVDARLHNDTPIRVSIVMPVYNTREEWLKQAIESVEVQTSGSWELICVDDGSTAGHVRNVLKIAAARHARIRHVECPERGGIARALNTGIALAEGDILTFLDHDDVLEPEAVELLVKASESGYGLIYSDEVLTHESVDACRYFSTRPSFSHDYYLSHPYFVHMVAAPTELVRSIGGWDENLQISADVDFVLRALEQSEVVTHIAKPLYRWRTHPDSAGHQAKELVVEATTAALQRHLDRLGRKERVVGGEVFNTYRLITPNVLTKVLIVIPTKDRLDLLKVCVSSIERTTVGEDVTIVIVDHESSDPDVLRYLKNSPHRVMKYRGGFNFSKMNNEAVSLYGIGHELVLFINNDVEAIDSEWFSTMKGAASRPDVGVVGATLIYPSGTIQHAGVAVGLGGYAEHVNKGKLLMNGGVRNPGDGCELVSTRDYLAVTAACMMMRKEVFDAVSGFDENFAVGFNDTDLCLRVVERGYKVLKHADAVLIHNESATRKSSGHLRHPEDAGRLRIRWSKLLQEGDPFFSPLKSLDPSDDNLQLCGGVHIRVRPGLKETVK